MLTVEEALALILGDISPLPPTRFPLNDLLGRVLAQDIVAAVDLPPFANSAVDGFAVRSSDLKEAAPASPVRLPVAGEAAAGTAPGSFPSGAVCVRIMTGAPVPEGADSVVMKEDVAEEDGFAQFSQPAPHGESVRPQGQDLSRGALAAAAGLTVRAPEVALLAASGFAEAWAHPHPRVAILTTGDELAPPGRPLRPGQIYNSNAPMLAALVRAAGFQVARIEQLPDDPNRTEQVFDAVSKECHVAISSGGVSVGEHDHVRAVLERRGDIRFWRVSMKPGKPLLYARLGNCFCFGLPGNPASSLVSFELFVRPALRQLAGHRNLHRPRVRARLLGPLHHRPGREEYARVTTSRHGDEFVTAPFSGQGSHLISSLVAANSLAVIPAEAGSLPEGARVDVLMTEWPEEPHGEPNLASPTAASDR